MGLRGLRDKGLLDFFKYNRPKYVYAIDCNKMTSLDYLLISGDFFFKKFELTKLGKIFVNSMLFYAHLKALVLDNKTQ